MKRTKKPPTAQHSPVTKIKPKAGSAVVGKSMYGGKPSAAKPTRLRRHGMRYSGR